MRDTIKTVKRGKQKTSNMKGEQENGSIKKRRLHNRDNSIYRL